jgi:photosynthetic reaction center cytochrome c subunit
MNARTRPGIPRVRPAALGLMIATLGLSACERPPVESVQIGYRGVQMQSVINPRTEAQRRAANVVPAPQPATDGIDGSIPLARDVYQNVKVIGDLQVTEFNRVMLAMVEWVSPVQGCDYCHNPENLAEDSKYTKVVARRMLEMTRHINMDWKAHVKETGVTCYTCHRGKNVPEATWFSAVESRPPGLTASRAGQNVAALEAGLSSLPEDPFTGYLTGDQVIRVISTSALPGGNEQNIKQTEQTYALMMHMSEGLGVNCTFCHNSRSFAEWDQSTPQRAQSWHGIRLVRDVNDNFLFGLTASFPARRLGPGGDVAKANCATCHRGVSKPLYGAAMARDYPELTRVRPAAAPAPAPAPEPGATSDAPAPVAGSSTRAPRPAAES